MKYKIIKKIDEGYQTIIYLIEIKNKKYILKQYLILEEKLNYRKNYWNEILVCKFIDKLKKNKQNFFMKLYDYKIDKCKTRNYEYFDDIKNKLVKKKTNNCLNLILEHKGDPLSDFILKKKMKSTKMKYCFLIQIIFILNILRKNGFVHNDVHSSNITFVKCSNPIKILNNKIICKYRYSLIDYEYSLHKKFRVKNQFVNEKLEINWDMLYFMRQIILQNNLLQDIYKKKQLKRIFIPKFKMEDIIVIYNKHKLVWNKIKNTLSMKGNQYINWFKTFESNNIHNFYKNFSDKYPVLLVSGKNMINLSIIDEIKCLLSAYNRKLWLKLNNWNVNIPNLIPKDDIIFMILNLKNNNKIIKYFINKYIN